MIQCFTKQTPMLFCWGHFLIQLTDYNHEGCLLWLGISPWPAWFEYLLYLSVLDPTVQWAYFWFIKLNSQLKISDWRWHIMCSLTFIYLFLSNTNIWYTSSMNMIIRLGWKSKIFVFGQTFPNQAKCKGQLLPKAKKMLLKNMGLL